MKKLLILMIMICVSALSFAQTRSSIKTSQKSSIEVVLNQQVEILNARIDSMTMAHKQAIESIRNEQKEQYANYYSQLDSHLERWLIVLSLIWGAIGVAFGALAPYFLNKESEKRVEKQVADLKQQVKDDITDLKQQIHISLQNNAKAQKSRNDLFTKILTKQIKEQSESFTNRIKTQKDFLGHSYSSRYPREFPHLHRKV